MRTLALILACLFVALTARAAAPSVAGTNSSENSSASTGHTVNLPASIASGDTLVVLFTWDFNGGATVSAPAGWSEAFNATTTDLMEVGLAVFYRQANGAEGATLSVTTSVACRTVHQAYRITGGGGGVEASASAEGIDVNPNPAALSPSWGTADVLSLAVAGIAPEDFALTSLPANYTDALNNQSTFQDLVSGRRQLTGVSSEDPGTFTWSGDPVEWIAATVLIAEGGGGAPPTISSATPSGTLATTTTATLGATSDDDTGTFYGVVDTDSLTGITATQIKAAQDAGGGAVVDDCNAAVSTTSPSCGVTGLTANTAYNYAVVHNNATGDSNVLIGSFTTAAAGCAVCVIIQQLGLVPANDDEYDQRLVVNAR